MEEIKNIDINREDSFSEPEKLSHDNIVENISSGKWENVLLALTSDMNPWDIDLVVLSARFMDYIKNTKKEDLRIPAKIILTAAILYRMKVDTFKIVEDDSGEGINAQEEAYNLETCNEKIDVSDIKIPPISVPIFRRPQGKVTLNELINALDNAMTIKNRREAREVFQIDLLGEDITDNIEELFEKICDNINVDNILKFSSIVDVSDKKKVIRNFNSMLHLSNQGRVSIDQPEMFGEIYLTVAQQ
ncbi:MAG: hypothetical protein K0B07_04525 [DPANN group archaeon]|nr:hypothetical protein [DPANN group archaeon]